MTFRRCRPSCLGSQGSGQTEGPDFRFASAHYSIQAARGTAPGLFLDPPQLRRLDRRSSGGSPASVSVSSDRPRHGAGFFFLGTKPADADRLGFGWSTRPRRFDSCRPDCGTPAVAERARPFGGCQTAQCSGGLAQASRYRKSRRRGARIRDSRVRLPQTLHREPRPLVRWRGRDSRAGLRCASLTGRGRIPIGCLAGRQKGSP
jgi:hypothetical protein